MPMGQPASSHQPVHGIGASDPTRTYRGCRTRCAAHGRLYRFVFLGSCLCPIQCSGATPRACTRIVYIFLAACKITDPTSRYRLVSILAMGFASAPCSISNFLPIRHDDSVRLVIFSFFRVANTSVHSMVRGTRLDKMLRLRGLNI